MAALPSTIDRTAITDMAAAYGQPCYGSSYTANPYGVYGNSYYQQVASGLASASARMPYLGASAASAYAYGTTPYSTAAAANFDYTTAYNAQYYNQAVRNGYYSGLAGATTGYQPTTTGTEVSPELPAFTLRPEPKKGKSSSKKKKGGCGSGSEGQFARVFIWDLSDISVYTGKALADVGHKVGFGFTASFSKLKLLVQQISLLSFPPDQNEDNELCNIEDAAIDEQEPPASEGCLPEGRSGADAMRRLAHRYIALKQTYTQHADNPEVLYDSLGSALKKEEVAECARQMDSVMDGRHTAAARCINLVAQRSAASPSTEKYGNVFLCSEGLVNGVVQSLLSGFAPSVPIENIYSALKTGKESVLERISARYGKKCSFVVVTANRETTQLARKENMAVWPISACGDLDKLYTAQSTFLLGRPR
ncbi:unnamed protein product, partial [Mesorhabditis spiculigera]